MWYEDLPFPYRIASNTWLLLAAFIVLIIALDLILVRWLKLDKIAWKKVDYIWLVLAALGLLSTSIESRRFLAISEVEQVKYKAELDYKFLQGQIHSAGDWICGPSRRTEHSPPNYDEIVQEFSTACGYYNSLLANISDEAPKKFSRFNLPENVKRPDITNITLNDSFVRLDQAIERYNILITEYANLIKLNDKTEFERTLIVLGPLLLAFALALRITKVTGEIKLERQADNSEK